MIYDIAIIGAGPAGISTAVEAIIFGIENIIIFEKGQNHSQTIRKYFDDNKPVDRDWKGIKVDLKGHIDFQEGTKESTLNLFQDSLDKHRLDALFETEVTSIEKIDNYFEITTNNNKILNSKNIVVAIGKMGKPNKPSYLLPKTLSKQINFNISDCKEGEKILVVGGGDSACEFAYFIYKYNDVTLNYRREKITRANPKNIKNLMDIVEQGKANLKLGVDIKSINDLDGRCEVSFTNDNIEVYDRIIYALGGSTPKEFLSNTPILLNEKLKPIVDEYNKNSDGVYMAGDIAGSLGGSISLALNHGYNIVKSISNSN